MKLKVFKEFVRESDMVYLGNIGKMYGVYSIAFDLNVKFCKFYHIEDAMRFFLGEIKGYFEGIEYANKEEQFIDEVDKIVEVDI